MTHTVVSVEHEVQGSRHVKFVTINITSLDENGEETSFDPAAFGINRVTGIDVVGVEDSAAVVNWNHLAGTLDVDGGTATDDVGEVALKVEGR